MGGVENDSEGWGEWRQVVEKAVKRNQLQNENKSRGPVSMPASSRTSGTTRRETNTRLRENRKDGQPSWEVILPQIATGGCPVFLSL